MTPAFFSSAQVLLRNSAVSVLLSAMLCACGQRGPLYLPEPPKAGTPTTTQGTNAKRVDDKKPAADTATDGKTVQP